MKKLFTLAVIFFSCTKNDIKPPQIISGNVKQVASVPNFSYNTSADWDLTATKKITYIHSPIVVYEIPSRSHAEKSLMLFSRNNNLFFFEAISLTTILSNNIKHWQLLSTDMREYYSFKVTPENYIYDFRVLNDITLFEPPNQMLTDAIPMPIDSVDNELRKFGKCMNETVGMCSSSWTCTFACGFLIGPCGAGMALSCFAHWWDSNQRR